jgi:hypothetical protein
MADVAGPGDTTRINLILRIVMPESKKRKGEVGRVKGCLTISLVGMKRVRRDGLPGAPGYLRIFERNSLNRFARIL